MTSLSKEDFKALVELASDVEFTNEPLLDGSLIQYYGEQIEVGDSPYLVSGDGSFTYLPDGEYTTKRHLKFTIVDAFVVSIDKKNGYTPPQPRPNPLPQGQYNKQNKEDEMKFDFSHMSRAKKDADKTIPEEAKFKKPVVEVALAKKEVEKDDDMDAESGPDEEGVLDTTGADGETDWSDEAAADVKDITGKLKKFKDAHDDLKKIVTKHSADMKAITESFAALKTENEKLRKQVLILSKQPATKMASEEEVETEFKTVDPAGREAFRSQSKAWQIVNMGRQKELSRVKK